jgi:PPM family protein phosphatase
MRTLSQTQFFAQIDSSEIESLTDRAWDASVGSQKNPHKLSANEDAAVVIRVDDDTAVFAIADGCGGMRGGEQASNLALQVLAESIENFEDSPARLRVAILDGIEQANRAVQELRIGAASTIAVVEFHRGLIRPYHVGDSMILVTSVRGKVRYQSVCHSPIGFAVESGLMAEDEAMHHEDRHLVSNVVGCDRMRIEIGPTIQLGRRDSVVIASDGLFDNLNMNEVIETVRKGKLEGCVETLSSLATSRMQGIDGQPCKPDDLSVIAIRAKQIL